MKLILKRIHCPKCGRPIHLLSGDFEIEQDPGDDRWTASHSIICRHPNCGAEFWIAYSEVVWVTPPPTN